MPEAKYKITFKLACELRPKGYRPGWNDKNVIAGIEAAFAEGLFGDATDVTPLRAADLSRNALDCSAEAHVYVAAENEAEALAEARERFGNLDFGDLILNKCIGEKIEAYEPYIQKRGIS